MNNKLRLFCAVRIPAPAMLSMINAKTVRPSGAPIDIVNDLGLHHAQKVYEQRIKALATPGAYSRDRKVEWDKLTAAVQATYDNTVGNPELATAGIPLVERQELAVNAAKMTFATQNAILEANFPSGVQSIALQSSALEGFHGVKYSDPQPAQKAPRKRATPSAPLPPSSL